jgi:hypothetical protein
MKATNVFQKLAPSAVLVIMTFIISTPFLYFWGVGLSYKLLLVAIFFSISLSSLLVKDGRDIGMIFFHTYWERKYKLWQKLVYSLLYSLSFSTLLFWIWVPFDLFAINILLLQLPCVIITGTTLHGYLSGGMKTIKK